MDNTEDLKRQYGDDINHTALHYFQSYNDTINSYIDQLILDIEAAEQIEEGFTQNMENLQTSIQDSLTMLEENRMTKLKNLENDFQEQLNELSNYKTILESKGDFATTKSLILNKIKQGILTLYNQSKDEVNDSFIANKASVENAPAKVMIDFQEKYEQDKINIIESIQKSRSLVVKETAFFDNYFETAIPDIVGLWSNLRTPDHSPLSFLCLGTSTLSLSSHELDIKLRHIIPYLDFNSLVLKYKTSENKILANSIVQAIIARLLMSIYPGGIKVNFIDPIRIGRSFTDFLKLPSNVLGKILTEEDDIESYLNNVYHNIRGLTQEYLSKSYSSLAQYNKDNQDSEPYNTIVISDFPNGFNEESKNLLSKIIINGPMVGVNVIILIESEEEGLAETDSVFDLTTQKMVHYFNFENQHFPFEINTTELKFIKHHDLPLSQIIDFINNSSELKMSNDFSQ